MNELIAPTQLAIQRATVASQADAASAATAFKDYITRKSKNTIKSQRFDLQRFAEYLLLIQFCDHSADELQTMPTCWDGMTFGIVEGFIKWQLGQGYAVSSVNRSLSTVKTYSKLAVKAGVIEDTAYRLITTVSGYAKKEAVNLNEKREKSRIGHKKAQHVAISAKQAAKLKSQPDTPQGRRDALMMCLLLDLGLRVSEVVLLRVDSFDVERGEMSFFRPKVQKDQTHKLTPDTLRALQAYLTHDAPEKGLILRGSRKGGKLTGKMSINAITQRVRTLGEQLGVDNLSAHDCRHFWATDAARSGTDPFALQEAGGWNSLAMPRRYVEDGKIANEGVKLTMARSGYQLTPQI